MLVALVFFLWRSHLPQVVTVAGHVVLEKHSPTTKKGGWIRKRLGKMNPFKKVKNAFRRSRRSTSNSGKDNTVSTLYSLHVVASGFEVLLDGRLVWGWDFDTSS